MQTAPQTKITTLMFVEMACSKDLMGKALDTLWVTTLNMIFSVTYYSELHIPISFY